MRSNTLTWGLALVAIILLPLTGCDSQLDLSPQQSINSETALQDAGDLNAAIVGGYNGLSDYDLYGGQLMMLPDMLGDDGDLFWDGTFEQPQQVIQKQIFIDNSFIESQYVDAYDVIDIANNVLLAADSLEAAGVPDITDQIRGQALFLRGVMHFELVRLFGRTYTDGDPSVNPGVPVILQPTRTIPEITQPSRSTVQDVYNAVISDLTQARDLLPTEDGPYADSFVASAMLSRVYLMTENFPGARDEANRVIESGKYNLASLYEQAFNQSTDPAEYVFAIQVSVQDNGNHSLGVFYDAEEQDPEGQGRGDIFVTDQHVARYVSGDARGEFFYFADAGDRFTRKWSTSNTSNIPVIRLPEMYLTRAEANFRLGTEVGNPPFEDINILRERADLDGADLYDAASLTLDDILDERVFELSFEGHRLHDLKRTQRSVGSIPFDDPSLVYPIPQRELDANPNLTQNSGYGT